MSTLDDFMTLRGNYGELGHRLHKELEEALKHFDNGGVAEFFHLALVLAALEHCDEFPFPNRELVYDVLEFTQSAKSAFPQCRKMRIADSPKVKMRESYRDTFIAALAARGWGIRVDNVLEFWEVLQWEAGYLYDNPDLPKLSANEIRESIRAFYEMPDEDAKNPRWDPNRNLYHPPPIKTINHWRKKPEYQEALRELVEIQGDPTGKPRIDEDSLPVCDMDSFFSDLDGPTSPH